MNYSQIIGLLNSVTRHHSGGGFTGWNPFSPGTPAPAPVGSLYSNNNEFNTQSGIQ